MSAIGFNIPRPFCRPAWVFHTDGMWWLWLFSYDKTGNRVFRKKVYFP